MLLQFQAPGEFTRVQGQLGECSLVCPPRLDCGGHRRTLPLEPAEGVEQFALPALIEETLLIVLAVDLNQPAGDIDQAGGSDGLVIHSGGGAARRRNLADADERLRHPVEQGLDPCLVGAMPDQGGVGPGADGEPQGIDEQALAGTGLSGQHIEPRLEGDGQPLDQGEVADAQFGQSTGRQRCALGRRALRTIGPTVRGGGLVRFARRIRCTCHVAGLEGLRHDGNNSDFWRSRSQNGTAPRGSISRMGRSISQTETMSPTASRRSSRPSTLISTS